MDPKLGNSLTAYRKNNGCDTALLRLVEKWKMDLDSRKVVGVYTLFQNGRHFSILLFPCKLALMASFKVKYSFEFYV